MQNEVPEHGARQREKLGIAARYCVQKAALDPGFTRNSYTVELEDRRIRGVFRQQLHYALAGELLRHLRQFRVAHGLLAFNGLSEPVYVLRSLAAVHFHKEGYTLQKARVGVLEHHLHDVIQRLFPASEHYGTRMEKVQRAAGAAYEAAYVGIEVAGVYRR